jgi:hypothetical protein
MREPATFGQRVIQRDVFLLPTGIFIFARYESVIAMIIAIEAVWFTQNN